MIEYFIFPLFRTSKIIRMMLKIIMTSTILMMLTIMMTLLILMFVRMLTITIMLMIRVTLMITMMLMITMTLTILKTDSQDDFIGSCTNVTRFVDIVGSSRSHCELVVSGG